MGTIRAQGPSDEVAAAVGTSGATDAWDGVGPDPSLFLCHRADRLCAAVVVFQACQIIEILLARQQRAVADVVGRVGTARDQPSNELLQHLLQDELPLIGIHEAEQDLVAQEHAPVIAEPHQQARPVERRTRFV